MPITVEKSPETDLVHDAIERYLREEVVKICHEIEADPTLCIPLEQARSKIKTLLREKYGEPQI